jgi:hypothetical protein
MTSWDEEEWWDDRDAPVTEPTRKTRLLSDDSFEPTFAPLPLEPELEGSLYRISDKLWGFSAKDRINHPGLCVRCDIRARNAITCIGRDVDSYWSRQADTVEVDPTAENGLTKQTTFDLNPWNLKLRLLQLIHTEEGPLGRLEAAPFTRIRDRILRLNPAPPRTRS